MSVLDLEEKRQRHRENSARYRARHPERVRHKNLIQNGKRIEVVREYNQKRRTTLEGRAVFLLTQARCNARKLGVDFDLTVDWVLSRLRLGKCEMTDLVFDLQHDGVHRRNPYGPSIDRKQRDGGYTQDNCRLVVTIFNFAKADWADDDLFILSLAIIRNRRKFL